MEAFAPWHLFIILAVIVLLFGGKKIPEVMKGLGEGVKNFKEGMNGNTSTTPATTPPASTPTNAPTVTTEEKK